MGMIRSVSSPPVVRPFFLTLRLTLSLTLGLFLWGCNSGPAPTPLPLRATRTAPHAAEPKIVLLVLENTAASEVLAHPTVQRLAKRGSLLTQYFGLTHPSQPNYIGMIGGSTFGVGTNDNVTLNERHLGNLIEDAGKSWKAYAEDYPGGCFLGEARGNYWRKHVPFLSFKNIQDTPSRCAKVVPDQEFERDYDGGTLADFSLFIPNAIHSGHDTDFNTAMGWVDRRFGKWLEGLNPDSQILFILTFDEDHLEPGNSNHILTLLLGNRVKPGGTSSQVYNHYSLLRSIEKILGLPSLGRNDARANPFSEIWTDANSQQ